MNDKEIVTTNTNIQKQGAANSHCVGGVGGLFGPRKVIINIRANFWGPGFEKPIRWGDFLGPSKVIINIRALLSPPPPTQ